MYKVKCKEKTSVYVTRVWYSRLQLSFRGKQFEKFHIKGVVVGGDDFNKQATLLNVMNTRFDSVEQLLSCYRSTWEQTNDTRPFLIQTRHHDSENCLGRILWVEVLSKQFSSFIRNVRFHVNFIHLNKDIPLLQRKGLCILLKKRKEFIFKPKG